jgi:hypothetical protein
MVITLLIVVIAIAAVSFWRGWFEIGSPKKEGDRVSTNLDVNLAKFKHDKESFKKYIGEKSKSMKEELDALVEKSKGLTGDARVKAEKEIDTLKSKHTNIEDKLKELEASGEEKFEEIKNAVKKEFDGEKTKIDAGKPK